MSKVYLPDAAVSRIMSGDVELLRDGLRRGLKPSILWPMWDAPLLHGICTFCPPRATAMAQLVLDAGESPQTTWKELTPLMCVLGGYNVESPDELGIRLELITLLAKNATPEELVLAGRLAIRRNHLEAVSLILQLGCPANATGKDGSPMLHEAYAEFNRDIAKLLVKHGADPYLTDGEGAIPALAIKKTIPVHEREAFILDIESASPQGNVEIKPMRL
jgi:hypothetical protein